MSKVTWDGMDEWIENELIDDDEERTRFRDRREELQKIRKDEKQMSENRINIVRDEPKRPAEKAAKEPKKVCPKLNFTAGEELVSRLRAYCAERKVPIGRFCCEAIKAALDGRAMSPMERTEAQLEPETADEDEKITRSNVLDEAKTIVCGDRETQYGSPEDNFAAVATLWNVYVKAKGDEPLKAHDVAAMMIQLKIARVATGKGKADNWVDIAGYAACGGECEAKEERR